MSQAPYIFRSRPHLCVKVWGGRRLEAMFDKALPSEEPFGESWEVADLPQGQSRVDTGTLQGWTLEELVKVWGAQLVGTLAEGERFPLLVKILDASEDLSVQVHPGAQHLDAFPEARSKDETWIILGVEEGGSVLHGFREEVTAESFRAAIARGNVVELLRRIEVAPGDVLRVNPGTVHAICKGVVLLEIQQPSDTTYRVYDYGRPGLDGQPRALHVDEAVAVTNYSGLDDEKIESFRRGGSERYDWKLLVDVYAYRAESLEFRGGCTWDVDPRSVQILFLLEGSCEVGEGGSRRGLVLTRGQTAVIPACVGRVDLFASQGAKIVVSGLGGVPLIVRPRQEKVPGPEVVARALEE